MKGGNVVTNFYTTRNEPLFTLKQLSELSDMSPKIIRQWIDNDELSAYITIYLHPNGRRLFKLGIPNAEDVLVKTNPNTYTTELVKETTHLKMIRRDTIAWQSEPIRESWEGDTE